MRFPVVIAFVFASAVAFAEASGLPDDAVEFFEKEVRPVLAEHCYKCHGPDKQKAELRLDSRAAILKGSDVGPVVIPGKPEESSLILSVKHEGDSKMPAKEPKLAAEQIAALVQWVKIGLPWPDKDAPKLSAVEEAARSHWSFQPIRKPEPPTVVDSTAWAQSPIDRFILARLQKERLAPSPRAARRTLLRRATYDLTGLPPSYKELVAFENDPAPDAFARVVERLLASPAYGERMGRHWLDVARYADTKGYVFQEERRYPFAYTYRDWVIRAFNDDMPYDQFLIRQIAADHLGESNDSLAALGFLTLGRRFINNIHDIIDDRIDVVSRGTMGLTVTCARCHDHKFDPVTQKDYYALYGVFASSKEPELNELPLLSSSMPTAEYEKERAAHQAKIQEFYVRRALEMSCLVSVAQGTPALVSTAAVEELFGSRNRVFTRKARDELRELRNKAARAEAGAGAPPRAMALVDRPQPVTPRVFIRGNAGRPGEEVARRFIALLAAGDPKPFQKGSGRLELAQAIASKDNPLTARVMVNRVWTQHFGRGLVPTPGDFGVKGERPSHPELLDWLASVFVAESWSVKKLHRAIMLSSTYQQTSDDRADAIERDPANRLLWRMNRRRLDFEALRDSLISVAGHLDATVGGRAVDITAQPFSRRRTVYGFIDRQNLPGMFRTFDFASPDTTSPQRHVTTVPQQALFMMNSPFVIEQARALVANLDFTEPPASERQIEALYQTILGRAAEPGEVEAGLQYVSAQLSRERSGQIGAWEKYAQVLLLTNEFAFVD